MKRLIKSTILVGGLLLLLLMLASQAQALITQFDITSPTQPFVNSHQWGSSSAGVMLRLNWAVPTDRINHVYVYISRATIPGDDPHDSRPRHWNGSSWIAGADNYAYPLSASRSGGSPASDGSVTYTWNAFDPAFFIQGARYTIHTRVYIHEGGVGDISRNGPTSTQFTYDNTDPTISYSELSSPRNDASGTIGEVRDDDTYSSSTVRYVDGQLIQATGGEYHYWTGGSTWVTTPTTIPASSISYIYRTDPHWKTFRFNPSGSIFYQDGLYYYKFFAHDMAGNYETGPQYSFYLDTNSPTVSLRTPSDSPDNYCTVSGSTVKYNGYNWNKKIQGRVSDPPKDGSTYASGINTVELEIVKAGGGPHFDGSVWDYSDAVIPVTPDASGNFSYTLPDSFFTGVSDRDQIWVSVWTKDQARNITIVDHNFYIDTEKPTSRIDNAPFFTTYPASIFGTAADHFNVDSVKLTIARNHPTEPTKYWVYSTAAHKYVWMDAPGIHGIEATLSGPSTARIFDFSTSHMFDEDEIGHSYTITAIAIDAAGNEQDPVTVKTIQHDPGSIFTTLQSPYSYFSAAFPFRTNPIVRVRTASVSPVTRVQLQIKRNGKYWDYTSESWVTSDAPPAVTWMDASGAAPNFTLDLNPYSGFWTGLQDGSTFEFNVHAENAITTVDITHTVIYDNTAPQNPNNLYGETNIKWQNTPLAKLDAGVHFSYGSDPIPSPGMAASGIFCYLGKITDPTGGITWGLALPTTPDFHWDMTAGEGVYIAEVLTFDNALNYPNDGSGTFSFNRAVNFKVGYDITAPAAFNITYPAAGSTIDTLTPTVTWDEARDSLSGIKNYTVKIGSYTSPTITDRSFAIPDSAGLINGSHTVQVIAEDNAGNTTTSSSTFNISTRVPPVIEITSPASGSWNNSSTLRVVGYASDDSRVNSVEILVNGVSAVTIPGPSSRIDIDNDVTVTSGADNIITVRALDDTGLTSEKVVVVKCDTEPPTAPNPIYPVNNGWATDHPTFRWEPSTDSLSGVAGYDLYLDSVKANTELITDAAYSVTGLPATDHTYSVTAYDNAGNSASCAPVNFKVDNVAPNAFTITAPSYADAAFDVSWTESADADSGLAAYEVYIDGSKVIEVAAPATSARITNIPADGSHTIYVLARDVAGNTTQSNNTLSIVTNPNCPDITLKVDGRIIANGDRIRSVPAINAEIRDNSGIDSGKVKIYIDEQLQENLTLHATETQAESITAYEAKQENVKLNAGKHTIKVTAQDIYGKETIVERIDLDVLGKAVIEGRVMNYPNPFKPVSGQPTSINYNLLDDADVMIRIYNMSGRLVWEKTCYARTEGGQFGENNVPFDGKSLYGEYLANGTYVGIITDLKGKVLATFELAVYE